MPEYFPDLAVPPFKATLRFNATGREVAIAVRLRNVVSIIPGTLELRALPDVATEELQGPTFTASIFIPRFPLSALRRGQPASRLSTQPSQSCIVSTCGGLWAPQITQSDGFSGCSAGCSMKAIFRRDRDWAGLPDLLGAKCFAQEHFVLSDCYRFSGLASTDLKLLAFAVLYTPTLCRRAW